MRSRVSFSYLTLSPRNVTLQASNHRSPLRISSFIALHPRTAVREIIPLASEPTYRKGRSYFDTSTLKQNVSTIKIVICDLFRDLKCGRSHIKPVIWIDQGLVLKSQLYMSIGFLLLETQSDAGLIFSYIVTKGPAPDNGASF